MSSHEKFIFLEDDAILSPYFLTFMNASLNYYKNVSKVMGVTGWKYPCGELESPNRIIFTVLLSRGHGALGETGGKCMNVMTQ